MSIRNAKAEEVKNYLGSYLVCKQMIDADSYAKDYGGGESHLCDNIILCAKMGEIEHFVRSLPICREQTLLFNHFLRGHSVEFCGEMMYVSRRTAYRILDSAINLAAEYYTAV